MEMLYRSVRKNDSKITLRIDPLLFGGFHFRSLFDLRSILVVNPFEELRPREPFLRFKVINTKISCDQKRAPVRTFQAQLPVWVNFCASAK
jgi:hypothetical protein